MAAAAARCVAGPDGAANGTSALWRYRRVLGGAPAAAVAPGIAASCRAADGSLPPVSLTLPLLRLATAPVEPRRVAAPAGAAAGYPPPVDVMHWLHWLGRWAPAAATARYWARSAGKSSSKNVDVPPPAAASSHAASPSYSVDKAWCVSSMRTGAGPPSRRPRRDWMWLRTAAERSDRP